MAKKYLPSIIIEGCDCSGKTTLSKNITTILNEYGVDDVSIMHCTSKDPKDYDYYYHTMRSVNTIFDRHFIGEMIYPEVFNRQSELSMVHFIKLLDFAKSLNVKIVVVCPPNEIIRSRLLNERPNEEAEVVASVEMINSKFKELAEYAISHNYENVLLLAPEDGNNDIEIVKKFLGV